MRIAVRAALVLVAGVTLLSPVRAAEPPLTPGAAAFLVLEPKGESSVARIEAALADADATVRAVAARVAGAAAPAGGCAALKAAFEKEKDAEAAREESRAMAALCGEAAVPDVAAGGPARPRLTVKDSRGELRPVADRAPLLRTVTDLPRGVALGVARAAGCSLTRASLAFAEITFRPQGVPGSINPRLMPGDEACRKTALVLFGLSRSAGDSPSPAGTPDRLAVVLDADALAAMDEAPADAPAPRAVEGGVKEPKEVRRVKPAYPESLRRQRLEGAAVLTARIDREGRVADVRVVEPAGTLATLSRDGTSLDLEALRAVALWRYDPARLDGQPVPVVLSVRISWAVSGPGMGAPDASMRR